VRVEAPLIRRFVHLAARFFGSFRRGAPAPADVAWVESLCAPPVFALWTAMPRADRHESVAVARRLEQTLATTPSAGDDGYVVAALMHDVGKTEAGLGTLGRVGATLVGFVVRGDRTRTWMERGGVRRRVGVYLHHDAVGAAALQAAGAPETAVVWAGAHHHPEAWPDLPIPPAVALALARADGEAQKLRIVT
jgi:hypothetical protein